MGASRWQPDRLLSVGMHCEALSASVAPSVEFVFSSCNRIPVFVQQVDRHGEEEFEYSWRFIPRWMDPGQRMPRCIPPDPARQPAMA